MTIKEQINAIDILSDCRYTSPTTPLAEMSAEGARFACAPFSFFHLTFAKACPTVRPCLNCEIFTLCLYGTFLPLRKP